MDPAEARRQAQTLEAFRRLEDIVADTNFREAVRVEGIVRKTHEETLAVLELMLDELKALRREMGEGGAGVREPAPPAPESPGDAIAQDYAESAE